MLQGNPLHPGLSLHGAAKTGYIDLHFLSCVTSRHLLILSATSTVAVDTARITAGIQACFNKNTSVSKANTKGIFFIDFSDWLCYTLERRSLSSSLGSTYFLGLCGFEVFRFPFEFRVIFSAMYAVISVRSDVARFITFSITVYQSISLTSFLYLLYHINCR